MRQQDPQRRSSLSGCATDHPERPRAKPSGHENGGTPTCRFELFGRFAAQVVPDNPGLFQHAKAKELVCYLLLFRERPHHREVLSDVLWPDQPAARKYLRQALWQLGDLSGGDRRPPALLIDADWVHLNPDADVWLDVAALEEPFLRMRHIPGEQLDDGQANVLQQAVQVYRADLLEGWYQEWCIYERERLKAIYLAMLEKLLVFCEMRGRHEDGLAYGEQILRHDRAHERTHQRLMRLHYLAGDRTAAIRQFDRCAAALQDELGVRPADRTRALCEEIRADQLAAISVGTARSPAGTDLAGGMMPGCRREQATVPLRQALRKLVDVKKLVEEGLEAVERP